MVIVEHSFSDLLRHPAEVTKDAEEADVLLRRRQEPDLRLSRADREMEREAAFAALARALRNLFVRHPEAAQALLDDAFPWQQFLPAAERSQFVAEFTQLAVAAGDLAAFGHIAQLIHEWRTTAQVHAEPGLAKRLHRPLKASGDPVNVPAD